MKVLHGGRTVLTSPCSVDGLFDLPWSFRRPTLSGAPARRLSLLGSSIGPSSFHKWDCVERCPFIQGIVQPQLPAVSSPSRCQPVAPSSVWHGPNHPQRPQ